MELPQVGRHCSLSSCNSLDFLPITCPFCENTFCGDHRLPSSHRCSSWSNDKQVSLCTQCQKLIYMESLSPEDTLTQHISSECKLYLFPPAKMSSSAKLECAVDRCHELDPRIGPAHCTACDRDFCLKHRYQTTHQCPALLIDPKEERKLAAQEKLAKTYKHTTTTTRSSSSSNLKRKVNPVVEMMKIKAKAKGLASVPMASRLYLYIKFPEDANLSQLEQPMYLDKYNRVGKTLDMLATYGRVKNQNHLLSADNDQRLGLYIEDQEGNLRLLDTSRTLEASVEQMNTLVLKRKRILS
ncbi:uncharacterized protein BX664DRAFT_322341 [Halteromyces radiatus]|uniref:uncharacterized protein n=1 Tax=Halteromyces radiatus TaxID=101107 RepID=UPI0022209835|nr:uncharacterized protein BX664DRAFT_322341 [Halteromyces radiatus]KAI8099891.1 hypothetical protein BX664DRAFT_322341 [Halteromyces radiatus]